MYLTSHSYSVSGCGRDEMKEEGGADHDLMASGSGHSAASTMQQQHQQYLGDVDVVLQNFPEIEWGSTPIPGTVLCVFSVVWSGVCVAYSTVCGVVCVCVCV